ncbi:MAG: class I SAM-dependent methyltransferase [Rhodospirillales bacterium]
MTENTKTFDCDLCGSADAAEIPVAPAYMGGQPLHVCRDCGFVYVRERRSPEAIARAWSEEIFKAGSKRAYTARIPAVKARQTYVAEFLHDAADLKGAAVCDIGAGEGQFLEIIRSPDFGAEVYGVEPSPSNCAAMRANGIECFEGAVEDFQASDEAQTRRFDVVTIMWTLENCNNCRGMLNAAWEILKPGGRICIATGSRLLVPFKKPLHLYLSPNPADTHCFRFSADTLQGLLAVSGFKTAHVNRYIDTDYLAVIGEKTDKGADIPWTRNNADGVIDFFARWDKETRAHYPPADTPEG